MQHRVTDLLAVTYSQKIKKKREVAQMTSSINGKDGKDRISRIMCKY